MRKRLYCFILFTCIVTSYAFAIELFPSYCLVYVTVDNESDLDAVSERVNQLTAQAEKDGSKYLFFLSKGANPVVTTKTKEAKEFINGIFSMGSKPTIIPEIEIETLLREIAKNDFATLDNNMDIQYLAAKIRFHFIIDKRFIALNYQEKIIGKLLSTCMLDKIKSQDCDFYSTIYLGQNKSAKSLLNPISPLGELFPFNYNKNISDDK